MTLTDRQFCDCGDAWVNGYCLGCDKYRSLTDQLIKHNRHEVAKCLEEIKKTGHGWMIALEVVEELTLCTIAAVRSECGCDKCKSYDK